MKSVAAVYARLDRAARGVADGNLSAWMGRRTDDAVRDVIARALTHAAEYRYGAQNRPPGYGATPKDILRVDPPIPGVPQTRHGVVVYARALTDEEVRGYELAPYVPLAGIVARLMERVDRYGAQYADQLRKGDTATLRSGLRGAIEEPFFTDIPHGDLWGQVADALLAKYPAAPVAPTPVPVAPVPVAPIETTTHAKIVNLGVGQFGVEVGGNVVARFRFRRTQSKYGPQTYASYTDLTTGEEIAIGYKFFADMRRAMIEKFGALAPTDTRRFPVQGFAASTLDAEADRLRDSPDEDDGDEDDAAIRAVVRAYEAGKRKALVVSRADADGMIAGLTILANTEDERAEAERKRPASKRDPERARMTRAASDGLSALSTRIFKAFR